MSDHSSLFRPGDMTRRMVVALLVVLVAAAAALLGVMTLYMNAEGAAFAKREADRHRAYLGESLQTPVWTLDTEQVARVCGAVAQNPDIVRLRVLDEKGHVLYDFSREGAPELSQSVALSRSGRPLGSVEFSLSGNRTDAEHARLQRNLVLVALLLIAVTALAGSVIIRLGLAGPLGRLSRRVDAIAEGDYAPGAEDGRDSEFAPILRRVEAMAERVATRERSLAAVNAELTHTRDSLEVRVSERTRDLMLANDKLTATVNELGLFRFLLDQATNAVYLFEKSGRIRYVNERACESHGRSAAELRSMTVFDIGDEFTGESWAEYMRDMDRAQDQGARRARYFRRDGSSFRVEIFSFRIRHSGGDFRAAIVIDITDRLRAEADLNRVNLLSDQALELTRSGYWSVPLDGSDAFIGSPRALAILGLTPGPDGRCSLDDWMDGVRRCDPVVAERIDRDFREVTEGRATRFDSRYAYRRPVDGKIIWLHDCGVVVADGTTRVPELHGVIQDVTEVVEAKRESELARRKAEEANRLKSEFLANMSHEIRTPMNAILGYAQLLERDSALAAAQQAQVRTIGRAGEHLLALINDVLEMSKIEAGRISVNAAAFDLAALVQNLVELYGERARVKGLTLDLDTDPSVPRYIVSDETKLRQSLLNLIGNAVKFTAAGGVTLSVRARPAEHDRVALEFSVCDTGPGMSEEEVARLFGAFVQTGAGIKSGAGTGLGLAISRSYARLLGGDITVNSTPGAGSVFTLTLEAQRAAAAEMPARVAAPKVLRLAPGAAPVRILVADDHAVNRALLTALLTPKGFEVREAANGAEAVDIFRTWAPRVVLMDMRMPVMDGYEACRQIKATPAGLDTFVLALTASAFEEDRAAVLAAGANAFMRKPFLQDELLALLGERLGLSFEYAADAAPAAAEGVVWDAAMLRAVPEETLRKFAEHGAAADYEALLGDCEALASSHPEAAAALRARVVAYDYDGLARLIASARE